MSESGSVTATAELPIVFILAKGRSGTTLLQTMLDAHPETIAPMESRFAIHFLNRYTGVTNWTAKIRERFIEDVTNEQKIRLFWELDEDSLKSSVHALPENASYGQFCKEVYGAAKSFFPKNVPRVIIDKNPIYALLTPHILKVFPKAKFIHVVRDYRGSSSSAAKLSDRVSMRQLGFRWLDSNQEIERLKERMPEHFHTVRYEDLLRNPKVTLVGIAEYLGLSYTDDMLTYHQTIEKSFEAYLQRSKSDEIRTFRKLGGTTVHKNLARPIDPTFIDKWKAVLSKGQVEELDQICGAFAKKYDYQSAVDTGIPSVSLDARIHRAKLRLYYNLPIWLRELKSKPSMAYLEQNG